MKLVNVTNIAFIILFIIITILFMVKINSANIYVEDVVSSTERNQEQRKQIRKPVVKETMMARYSAKAEQIKTITDTLWCENRKSEKSMRLVLSVLYNRAETKTLDGIYKEAVKPYQFSCLNDPSIVAEQSRSPADMEMHQKAKKIVYKMARGAFRPLTKAKFYYAYNTISKPSYLKDKPLLLSFEGHNFH